MAIVTIRCSKCDEVKPGEQVEVKASENICEECQTPDKVKEVDEIDAEGESKVESESEEEPEGDAQSEKKPSENESEESEEELTPDDFMANDALSW